MGENLTLPCEKSGSYLRVSRLTPSTVRAKARTNGVLASQISTPLSSCVPPCSSSVPNSSRFSSASNVSWTDAAYDDLLEPFPSTLLSSVLGGIIEFGRKPFFESDFSLTATALNPGMLKHGKVVDVNHLHVSLTHAHASVLQATARQHGFRLTGKLVLWFYVQHARRGTGRRLPITQRYALLANPTIHAALPRGSKRPNEGPLCMCYHTLHGIRC